MSDKRAELIEKMARALAGKGAWYWQSRHNDTAEIESEIAELRHDDCAVVEKILAAIEEQNAVVPLEATEEMVASVNRNCDTPDADLGWTWAHFLAAGPYKVQK